jgi:hypothetical protein
MSRPNNNTNGTIAYKMNLQILELVPSRTIPTTEIRSLLLVLDPTLTVTESHA